MEKCPSGKIRRKGYTTKSGKKVKSSCIKKQTYLSEKRERVIKRMSRTRSRSIARKMYKSPVCKKGEIVREGYVRRAYTKKDGTKVKRTVVSPKCVKDVGLPGKGSPKIGRLMKGTLSEFGYSDVKNLTERQRHIALKKAAKDYPLSVYRKLIAISTLNKNKDPKLSKLFRKDAEWVKSKFM